MQWPRIWQGVWLTLVMVMAACSKDSGEGSSAGEDTGSQDIDTGEGDDTLAPDTSEPDTDDEETDVNDEEEVDATVDPADVVCRFCTRAADCEGFGTCLQSDVTGETFCGFFCDADPSVCPSGTTCELLNDGTQQCLPQGGFCTNPCIGVECDEGLICDPLGDGSCTPPRSLCEPCELNEQCGEENACLTWADIDGASNCTVRCEPDTLACPEGYFCANVTNLPNPQCVPEILTCTDRCVDVECEGENEVCDPLSGFCNVRAELCEPCVTNAECGDSNLCLLLPGPDCVTDDDCADTEVCSDGTCGSAHCATDCSTDPFACPVGYECYTVSGSANVCLPITLTCTDRCQGVTCASGFNCDPQQGECIASTLDACGTPCDNNASCGDQDDLCLTVGTSTFCAVSCGSDVPCPLGYRCIQSVGGFEHCAPDTADFSCEACTGADCRGDTVCNPRTGACESPAVPCDFSSLPEDCPDGQLCNAFEGRCEPIGTPCDFNTRFEACDFSISQCTAAAIDRTGTCEQDCFGAGTCPLERPVCENYHGLFGGTCLPTGFQGASTCAELMPTSDPIGRPCDTESDPRDPEQCTTASADYCLEGVDAGVGGFCTRTCTTDTDCGTETCESFAAGRFCVPARCGCLAERVVPEGFNDVFDLAMTAADLSTCAAGLSLEDLRRLGPVATIDNPWRTAAWGSYTAEPLRMVELVGPMRAVADAGDITDRALAALTMLASSTGVPTTFASVSELIADEDPLVAAVQALATLRSGTVDEAQAETLRGLDPQLQRVLATLLVQVQRIAVDQRTAFVGVDEDLTDWTALAGLWAAGGTELSWLDRRVASLAMDTGRRSAIVRMAARAIGAIGNVDTETPFEAPAGVVRVDTPFGAIGIGTADGDTWLGEEGWLLVVEPGGDDTYIGAMACNQGIEQPFAIVLDLGGSDAWIYEVEPDPADRDDLPAADAAGRAAPLRGGDGPVSLSFEASQGAGLFGVGMAVDLGPGDDVYTSLRFSQGFGLLGAGILLDDSAASFELESFGQGAGLMGYGLFVLGQGEHGHSITANGLGWGAAGGAGAFVGGDENDIYTCGTSSEREVVYADTPARRSRSLCAGMGAGLGRTEGDGPSDTPFEANVAGGVGVFIEPAGDDQYTASNGSMAWAHHGGIGVFGDLEGNDVRVTEDQSAAAASVRAHAFFFDQNGHDRHTATDTSMAWATDASHVVLWDAAGDDTWTSAGSGLSFAQFNALTWFMDDDGDDTYSVGSSSAYGRATLTILGRDPAGNPRGLVPTHALFMDASGLDSYAGPDLAAVGVEDSAEWEQVPFEERDFPVRGAGIDINGVLVLPWAPAAP